MLVFIDKVFICFQFIRLLQQIFCKQLLFYHLFLVTPLLKYLVKLFLQNVIVFFEYSHTICKLTCFILVDSNSVPKKRILLVLAFLSKIFSSHFFSLISMHFSVNSSIIYISYFHLADANGAAWLMNE